MACIVLCFMAHQAVESNNKLDSEDVGKKFSCLLGQLIILALKKLLLSDLIT